MSMLGLEHFTRAREALARDVAALRAERFGKVTKGPAFDHDSMLQVEIPEKPAPPIAFHVVYRDARGEHSGRIITLRGLKHEIAEIRVTAHCHWRNNVRTFLASRLVEVTDLSTGEISEDGLDYFRGHPMLQGLTVDGIANLSLETIAMQECRDEVTLLTFIAAADGRYDEDERDAIVLHVMERVPEEGLREGEIRRRVKAFLPDERAFEGALRRLCDGEGDARALMRSMRRVIDADGDFDAEEMAFAQEIEGRLRAAGRL